MITRGFLGAALALLLGCAANPEPATMGPMSATNGAMQMDMEASCPMHTQDMQGMMQGQNMQGTMQMPMMMPGEECPCPCCGAAKDRPAP